MTNFHVGQKVVCFRDISAEPLSEHFIARGGVIPVVGDVFTVRGIFTTEVCLEVGVYLEEIRNPEMDTRIGRMEFPFPAHCFRPVADRKTSIKIFTDMLKTQRTGVRA